MLEQAVDFRDESAALHALVEPLPEDAFARPTLFKGWTIDDILGHLHYGNLLALHSLKGAPEFDALRAGMTALRESGLDTPAATARMLGGLRGPSLRAAWRDFCGPMSEAFAAADPKARVRWVGPDMSVRSSITARLMETWSHGQAIFDLLGVDRVDTDRIRNIAVLGVNTFGWTFVNRGEPAPDVKPFVRLTGPSGAIWEWNARSEAERIEGPAVAFCQVVTQTRNVADTSLAVRGPVASRWMAVAQCFAGPARTPPAPGTRHKG